MWFVLEDHLNLNDAHHKHAEIYLVSGCHIGQGKALLFWVKIASSHLLDSPFPHNMLLSFAYSPQDPQFQHMLAPGPWGEPEKMGCLVGFRKRTRQISFPSVIVHIST